MNHAPWDIQAIRGHFGFPEQGRVVTNNAASTQPPRELLQLYQTLAPAYDNVHRGQSDASQITTARFEAAYDNIAQFVGAPSRRNIVVVRNTTEAHNTVMYSLMTRVPRRRQRGHHDDGAQLQLRAVVRDVPRDPAAVRPPGRVPGRALRPDDRRARPRAPGLAGRRPHQAGLLHRRVELLRHQEPAGRVRALADASGYAPADRRARARSCWSTARSWCRAPSSTSRHWTWTSCRSRSTRCSRRSASACCIAKEHLLDASLPFLYGGDMIAEGRVSAGPCRVQRAALEVRRRHTEHPRHDRRRAGAAPAARPGARPAAAAVLRRPTAPSPRPTSRSAMHRIGECTPAAHCARPRTARPRFLASRSTARRDAARAKRAGGVQRRRAQPDRSWREASERARRGVARGLPLRDARAPGIEAGSDGQLPVELLPLQHAGGGRPCGRRAAGRGEVDPPARNVNARRRDFAQAGPAARSRRLKVLRERRVRQQSPCRGTADRRGPRSSASWLSEEGGRSPLHRQAPSCRCLRTRA